VCSNADWVVIKMLLLMMMMMMMMPFVDKAPEASDMKLCTLAHRHTDEKRLYNMSIVSLWCSMKGATVKRTKGVDRGSERRSGGPLTPSKIGADVRNGIWRLCRTGVNVMAVATCNFDTLETAALTISTISRGVKGEKSA